MEELWAISLLFIALVSMGGGVFIFFINQGLEQHEAGRADPFPDTDENELESQTESS
ncbi:hypothetical protein [Bacillus massiliglaciei]|uniref:hypothetical protein n=1 Tax=Bacillus massiliglaciei TaxID=1816693 RepID=UPI0018FE63D6|nr:hypothetical protein [Bacillus massiliglaciei]